jgi:hypothetical protein
VSASGSSRNSGASARQASSARPAKTPRSATASGVSTTETFSASGMAYSAKRVSRCGASPRSKLALPPNT